MPILRALGTALILLGLLASAGCGASVGTSVPRWAGGLSPEAPARAENQPAYPDVQELPAPRPVRLATEPEQAKLEAELTAIRNKTNAQSEALQKERTGR